MMMKRFSAAALLMMFLGLNTTAAWAEPGKNQGKGHGNGSAHTTAAPGNSGNAGKHSQGKHGNAFTVDVPSIRVVIRNNRDYWDQPSTLPPGIQKNLARGKPLPPGIARKLDSRLLGKLPHYDGYDWRQAGTDLILVSIATGVIHEVLSDVFD